MAPTHHHDEATATSITSREEAEDKSSGPETPMNDSHVCGDIIQVCTLSSRPGTEANEYIVKLIPSTEEVMCRAPYITASGAAFNAEKNDGVFDCNVPQYTTFYRDHRHLSTLPIRAHFDDVRYKNKKPIPSNNNYVTVEGFLYQVDVDTNTGQPLLFHINAENIAFLGKAVLPNTPLANQGTLCLQTNVKSQLTVLVSSVPFYPEILSI